IFIIFLLVKELYDEKTALLASFIYALIPTVVIGSRLVQNENFFIPVFLLSLFLIFRFIKTKKNKFFLLAAFICGLLTLAKVPWIAAGISIGLILLYNRKYKHLLLLIGIVISVFSLFILYGYYYNWDLFISLWKFQFQRYEMAFNSIFTLFAEPYLADRFTIDGWIYFGWISFFLLLAKNLRKNYILIFGLLGYLAVFVFAIPNTPGHGWYKYPFYPFLAISLAIFIKDHFNKNLLFTFMFILFTGLSLLELTWTKTFGFSFSILRIFILLAGTSLFPLFFKNSKLKKYSRVFNYLMLIFIFFLSIWAVLAYNEQ
ncbi:MAG: glycosyltransferase family 39 protein, partial [Patescibacteria group bacterium]